MHPTSKKYVRASSVLLALTLLLTGTPALADTSISIQSLSPGVNVPIGAPVTFTVVPSGFPNTSYSFSLTDTDPDSTVKNSNMDSTGHFSWTPTSKELGEHTIIVQASAGGVSANVSQPVTVGGSAAVAASASAVSASARALTVSSLNPGDTVSFGTRISANLIPSGIIPNFYFVSDSFNGTSVSFANVNATGVFSWVTEARDVGTHILSFVASDISGNNATASTTVVVSQYGGSAPVVTTTSAPMITPAAHIFTVLLQTGSTGDDVKALQAILLRGGYLTAAPNGVYGLGTVAAVKQYQSAHGLSPVGNVGPATRAALNAEAGAPSLAATVAPTPTVVTPSSSSGMSAAARQVLLQLAAQLQQIVAQLNALAGSQ